VSGGAPTPEVLRQVRTAVAARRYGEAQQLAQRELDAGAEHPQLLHLRAIWHEEQQRFPEALADLEHAHRLDPSEFAVVMALGNLLERLNRRVDARDVFRRAVALRPDLVGTHVRLGWACENLGEIDGARAAYERAVQLDPTHAQALGRLAVIASQQGDWDEARRWAARSLAANPKEFNAELAYIRADLRQGRPEDAEQRLDRVLASPLAPDDVYLAHKELGALRHQQGRYEEAFAAWTKGNELAHQHYAPMFAAPRGVAGFTELLGEYLTAQEPWPPAPSASGPAKTHVFLLGFARSGTTLLEQVLAAHPDVVSLEEKDTLGAVVERFPISSHGLDALRDADEAALEPVRAVYWQDVTSHGVDPTSRVLIDKSPFNALRLAHIARLFPQARVLFALRDPRDVILSCLRTPFRVNGIVHQLLRVEDAGRYYASYMRAAEQIRRVVPMNCLQLRHEDLLDDFEGEIRRVCEFIGIDLQPGMLSFESAERKVATPSAHQLREGLTRARSGQWTHYAEQLAPAIRHLQPWIERFGYV